MESSFSTSTRVYEQTVLGMVKRRVKIAKLRRDAIELGVTIQPEEEIILSRISESSWFPYR